MAHRRSGAQRRALQKAAQRARQEAEATNAATGENNAQNDSTATPQPQATPSRPGKQPPLTPDEAEVVAAVATLYVDQLKPLGRLLRKRVAERHAMVASEGALSADAPLRDVDVQHLRSVCEECSQLSVQPEEAGDWSVTVIGCPDKFVDVYSSDDLYPQDMWRSAAEYFEGAGEEEMTLPGGRYSCAQALLSRNLPFLAGRSLGQVCHIVQLAISQKKLLGYLNGSVVSYSRSQSMMKERCAFEQTALANSSPEAADLPFATWETARECLREILQEAATAQPGDGPGSVPLSNIKRAFRSNHNLELSETRLGHSKLSELLQDRRFADICVVQLDGHGYSVVQADSTASANPGLEQFVEVSDDALEPRKLIFCPDEPLCIDDAREPAADQPMFGPTPGPFGPTPMVSPLPPYPHDVVVPTATEHDTMFLAQFLNSTRPGELKDNGIQADSQENAFCPDEPLCLDELDDAPDMLTFGQTPGPFGPTPTLPLPHVPAPEQAIWPPAGLDIPPPGYDWGYPPIGWDLAWASMVHNTFIHAPPLPPTPVRRSVSLPQDAGVDAPIAEDSCTALTSLIRPQVERHCASSGSTTARSSSSGEDSVRSALKASSAEEPPRVLSLASHLLLG